MEAHIIVDKILNMYNVNTWERSDSVVECLTRDQMLEPHLCHRILLLSKNINPSLVLVQHRKARPYITERLLTRRKESNQQCEYITCHRIAE